MAPPARQGNPPQELTQGRVHELSVVPGREGFLGRATIARGSADYKLIPHSFNWAKT